jgi:hypothetical protein
MPIKEMTFEINKGDLKPGTNRPPERIRQPFWDEPYDRTPGADELTEE